MVFLRRGVAVLCLAGCLIIALAVAHAPQMRPDKPGIAAMALLTSGALAAWRLPRNPVGPWLWVLALSCVIALPFAVIARSFGRVDMVALLFHWELGIKGASLWSLRSEIVTAGLALLLVVLSSAMIGGLSHRLRRVVPLIAVAVLAFNPLSRHLATRALATPSSIDLVAEAGNPGLTAPSAADPDLVILYLEGTDRRFADPGIGGSAYAPLQALADQGIAFTQVGQIVGTGFSVAGMVASQCGVPLMPRGLIYKRNLHDIRDFLPAIDCLGDVLSHRGYATEFIVGGVEAFGGIDALYRAHAIPQVLGRDRVAAMFPPAEVTAADLGWVLDDRIVLDAARMRFGALADEPAPFALIVETVGPHGNLGYLSRHCTDTGRAQESLDVRRVVACLAADAARFVKDIRAMHRDSRRPRDLRIAVLSDHLFHSPLPAPSRPEPAANTVILLGQAAVGLVIGTPGSMVDVYPTFLEWLGMAEPPVRAGIGRSLFPGNPATLVALHGVADVDRALVADAAFSAWLWREE